MMIGTQQRQGAPQRFQVIAATTAGAAVDQQVRVPAEQFVPERQVSFHVANLGDPLPIGLVRTAPIAQRLDIEVLPVDVDLLLTEKFIDMICEPGAGFRQPRFKSPPLLPP